MNPDQRRPLEIRLRTLGDVPSGFSERAANAFGRSTADAAVILRALIDDGALTIQVVGVQGDAAEPIAPGPMFHLWLSFTGTIARLPIPEDNELLASQIVFVKKMLMMMGLTPELGPLAQAQASTELKGPDASPPDPSSTPAEPTTPQDAAGLSLDSASPQDRN